MEQPETIEILVANCARCAHLFILTGAMDAIHEGLDPYKDAACPVCGCDSWGVMIQGRVRAPAPSDQDDDETRPDFQGPCIRCGDVRELNNDGLCIDCENEDDAQRKQQANANAIADGNWPPYPSEY